MDPTSTPTRPADREAALTDQLRALENPPARAKLSPAQQDLAARYYPLAKSLAKRPKEAFPELADDLESGATLGLVHAARGFDPGVGVGFATYARPWIRGAIKSALRDAGRREAPRPDAFEPGGVRSDDGKGRVLFTGPARDAADAVEAADEAEACLNRLAAHSPRKAAVVRELYLNGRTFRETPAVVGCSLSKVIHHHRSGLDYLKKPAK